MTQRDEWADIAKGLAIILVVYGHVARGLLDGGFATPPLLRAIDFGIYTFHMPVFFLLSGIWVDRTISKGRGDFIRRRAWTVAYPYVLWSLLQGGLMLALAGSVNNAPTAGDLAAIWFRPIAQWWFLYALMAFHLLAAMLWPRRLVLLAISTILLVAAPLLPGILEKIAYNLVFYVAGAWIGQAGLVQPFSKSKMAIIGLSSMALVAVSTPFFMAWSSSPNTVMTLPLTLMGCVGVVSLAMAASQSRALLMLGTASMTIYVLHIIAGAGARVILGKLGVPHVTEVYLIVCTVIGVGGPLVAHLIMERLKLLPYLGLAPLPVRDRHAVHATAEV